MEGALEKLPRSTSASLKLEVVVEQLDYSQDMSHQIVNEFGDVSRSIDDIQSTIRNVTLVLEELKRELAMREAYLAALRDLYVDFEIDIKYLTTQRDNIICNVAQAVTLLAELERVRLAIEEQVNALSRDLL